MDKKIIKKLKNLSASLKNENEETAQIIKNSFLDNLIDTLSSTQIKRGDRGSEVREVQQALVNKGFELPRHGVDGIFGPETESAVKSFQKENMVVPNGVVDENTASKLGILFKLVFPKTEQKKIEEPPEVRERRDIFDILGLRRKGFKAKRYRPGSSGMKKLFLNAGLSMGLDPITAKNWSESEALENILRKESDGWVGIPNYTYGHRKNDKSLWPEVHEEIRAGKMATSSDATGLGQLLSRNVDLYYPSGRDGIGDPMEEAIGMLRYIKDRYGTPEKAWNSYGGKAVKTDPHTGRTFTEGY